jgi:uncharacterized membrane protein YoaK (UPF0700 family)
MTGLRKRTETVLEGILLATVGGFLDAYTFIGHRVFANAQTGNVVLFGIAAASRHWREAFIHLPPVAAFLVGVAAAETLGRPRLHRWLHRPLRVALGIEIVVLTAVAVLPEQTPGLVITVSISLVAAIQFATFRILVDVPYSTVLASGNLRGMAVAGHRWLLERDPSAGRQAVRFGVVVAGFTAGAVIGGVCTNQFGAPAVAVAAGLLLTVLVLLISETRRIERVTSPPADESTSARDGEQDGSGGDR